MLVTYAKIRLFKILAPLTVVGLDNGAKSDYFSTRVRSHLNFSTLY